ncbi:PilZ domain-containing protein [Vreelandella utahensis]|uniref:PilZ domain-containing protein n=1 Tax=Vreelandella halophila TaxID=86177 RepID=UPI000984ABC7|nr:PilZ domain-containing protein [Halomonas utahensis]
MSALSTSASLTGRPNLRHYHRIPVNLEAFLERGGETLPNCTVNDLSRAGLQIECAPDTLEQLVPNGEPVAPHMAIPVQVVFTIPLGKSDSTCIRARCDVVAVRRIARDCFHVGMSFAEFEEDALPMLDHYINEQLSAGA